MSLFPWSDTVALVTFFTNNFDHDSVVLFNALIEVEEAGVGTGVTLARTADNFDAIWKSVNSSIRSEKKDNLDDFSVDDLEVAAGMGQFWELKSDEFNWRFNSGAIYFLTTESDGHVGIADWLEEEGIFPWRDDVGTTSWLEEEGMVVGIGTLVSSLFAKTWHLLHHLDKLLEIH